MAASRAELKIRYRIGVQAKRVLPIVDLDKVVLA